MARETVVVELRVYGLGGRPSRPRLRTVALPCGATVGDLMAWWREAEPGNPAGSLLVVVNGQLARHLAGEATPLRSGDHVALMRPVAGGSHAARAS